MISDAALIALVDAGVDARAIVGAILADRAALRARRAERAAARAAGGALQPRPSKCAFGAPQGEGGVGVANPDSESAFVETGVRVEGAATASGGNRKSVARAALLMLPGLRPAARAVGAQLVERFNLATGQCNPSLATLAKDTGFSMRSARRALAELAALGLISRAVHGYGRANAYRLNWPMLLAAAKASEVGATAATNPDSVANPDSAGREPGQQSPPKPEKETSQGIPFVAPAARRRASSPKPKPFDPRQRHLMLPIAGGGAAAPVARSLPDGEGQRLAALPDAGSPEGRAEDRLFQAVLGWAKRAGDGRATLTLLKAYGDLPDTVKAEARAAERRKPGDGLVRVRAAMDAMAVQQRKVG